ncbi:MAG: thioredoxin domain-containing protein [Cryomorphaceae bacterium]|nr:thioredoxin domain-containing protein [Cryomorphaceae bacterium]
MELLFFCTMEKYTNELIKESSPYLRQHAHNPVQWIPWSDDLFERAKRENKPVLISVGYSACHWCHVMEHECFEDEEVAALMNKHFINVKVDREERPDVDQVYMTAVQLMTQRGGWPLNCFTLPDGRPIYGGTYFPKDQWMHILRSLDHTFRTDLDKAVSYAEKLHEGIVLHELIDEPVKNEDLTQEKLHELVLRWSRSFDISEGGDARAPKFPLPSNYQFLLHYGVRFDHEKTLRHVELTLDKMAMGGIYDQIGGGFTRYSVDMLWKVPHFEKMLYDNGQLISLYANAFRHFKKPLYKRTVYQIVEWLQREMLSKDGAFYSALDADSEGEEGKFYCWNPSEMSTVLSKEDQWVLEFYNINQRGYWEDEKYIPLRTSSDVEVMRKKGWDEEELEKQIKRINGILLDERSHRIRPGLDTKRLTSWNAMVITGLCDAYGAFGDEEFLHLALKNARWIVSARIHNGKLLRSAGSEEKHIEGFLEDYAHVIEAFIHLYSITFDRSWLDLAMDLSETVRSEFQDAHSKMCYFTAANSTLIARKMDLNDNVLPSGNSLMATNFYRLGELFHKEEYTQDAKQMLMNIHDGMEQYGSGYSGWGSLLMQFTCPSFQLAIVGSDVQEMHQALLKDYLPHAIFCGGLDLSIPVLQDKSIMDKTMVYVCTDGACLMPTSKLDEVRKQLSNTGY